MKDTALIILDLRAAYMRIRIRRPLRCRVPLCNVILDHLEGGYIIAAIVMYNEF